MRQITSFVKQWLIPGTMPMLMLAVTIGLILMTVLPAPGWIARGWMTVVVVVYWTLSLPAVSSALTDRPARRTIAIETGDQARHAQVLVALGNGSVHYTDGPRAVDYLTRRSVFSVFEACRVYTLTRPALVIATGGSAGHPDAAPEAALMRDLLVAWGVPGERIAVDTRSRSTHEQVTNVLTIVRDRGITGPLIVVTTAAHMARVSALFQQAGASIVPSAASELRYDDGATGWRRWRPSMAALTGSASAMYELLARLRPAARPEPPR